MNCRTTSSCLIYTYLESLKKRRVKNRKKFLKQKFVTFFKIYLKLVTKGNVKSNQNIHYVQTKSSKDYRRFLLENNVSQRQWSSFKLLKGKKKTTAIPEFELIKTVFQNPKLNKNFFKHTKVERIHPQLTCTKINVFKEILQA